MEAFRPLLAFRFARELRRLGGQRGLLPRLPVPEVLFVCTHNAARSQLAAAVLQHEAAGRVIVSAGTAPAPAVQPEVLTALARPA